MCLVPVVLAMATGPGVTASAAPVQTATIEDTSIGTGTNQVSYAGAWTLCGGCSPATPNNSFRYSSAAGATATIRFTGTQIKIYGIVERHGGLANITVDGGPPLTIDTYVAASLNTQIYDSGPLANGVHTAVLRNLGQHTDGSDSFAVSFDRASVYTDTSAPPGPTATVEDTNVGTGRNQVSYDGDWIRCGGCVPPTPNNSFRYTATGGNDATIRFTGTQLKIYGVKEHSGGMAAVNVDFQPASTTVDLYSPTSVNVLIFDSGVLSNTTHTVILTNIGQKNAAADGFVVAFDRAQVYNTTVTPPPGQTTTIEDSTIGVGAVVYVGPWTTCTGCAPATPNGSYFTSAAGGATATIRFAGTRIKVYGIKQPSAGLASIALDGGTPTTINYYASAAADAMTYDSGPISDGPHTVLLTNLGRHNAPSSANVVTFDRAEVTVGTTTALPPLGRRSGQPWFSGINGDPTMTPSDTDAFCDWRGAPCDLAHVYVARDSWDSIVKPNFALQNYAGWPGQLEISVPPFPENVGATLQKCATGAYDSYWRTFGQTLNSTGRQFSIVRLAWEANGDWFDWSATDPVAYVGCWRKVADAIRSTANPNPYIGWPINAHYSQNPPSHNPADIYPGDQWVDIISIDAYDHFPPSPTLAAFNSQANAIGGITWLYNFAKAHGKLFGSGEWGIAPGSSDGDGDNANYIQYMRDWMVARAGENFYYEAYFNNCDSGNVGSNLWRPLSASCHYLNTNAGNRYRQLW